MKMVAVLPPSERLPEQRAMIQMLFQGHETAVVTSREELLPHLADVELLVSTVFTPITREMLEQAGRLRLIQVAGVGADHIDQEAARELGIGIAVVTGANTISVAEHVVMVALALLRGLLPAHQALQGGEWSLPLWMRQARDLSGKIVGILGMGRIGREVAARLLPFGVTIFYYDQNPLPAEEEDRLGATYVDLETLLRESDLLTLHLPLTPETRGILNRVALQKMKQGAFLINTARAELVEESALIEALQDRLGGAALDVFPLEPPPPDHPLLKLPNVILTPHGAGVTIEAQERIAQGVIQNVFRFLEGRPLADLVVEGRRSSP